MGCYKIHTLHFERSPLRVVYRRGVSEGKEVQMWYQIDTKAEQAGYYMSPYCAMDDRSMRSKIVTRSHNLERELCKALHSMDKGLSDPNGDLPFLAVGGIAFATGVATNGIKNVDNGENFWSNGFSSPENGLRISSIKSWKGNPIWVGNRYIGLTLVIIFFGNLSNLENEQN